jgi:hypothetical protein
MKGQQRLEAQAEFVKRFIDRLGDVADWEHTGEVIELEYGAGHCVCGHPIKYLFIIQNIKTHQTASVGSECINHFSTYSPSLYAALTATIGRKKEEARIQKELEKQARRDEIVAIYTEKVKYIVARYLERFKDSFWNEDYYLWSSVNKTFQLSPNRPYKTLGGIIRWYERQHKLVEAFLSKYPDYRPLPMVI